MAASKKTKSGGTSARKTTGRRTRKTEIKLDGNRLVEALTAAGLDPKRLDVERTIGKAASATAARRAFRDADITELDSRLRAAGTTAAKPQWKVGVVVEF